MWCCDVAHAQHAGSPWELGLVEAHSSLLSNGLRQRVLLRVDGGLKVGGYVVGWLGGWMGEWVGG